MKQILIVFFFLLLTTCLTAQKNAFEFGISHTFFFDKTPSKIFTINTIPVPTEYTYARLINKQYSVSFSYFYAVYHYSKMLFHEGDIMSRNINIFQIGVNRKIWSNKSWYSNLGGNFLYRIGNERQFQGQTQWELYSNTRNNSGFGLGVVGQLGYSINSRLFVDLSSTYINIFKQKYSSRMLVTSLGLGFLF